MRGFVTQVLLSMSLAGLAYCADSTATTDDASRNKRSLQSETAHRLLSKIRLPFWLKKDRHQNFKRNGLDSFLRFDDLVWDDPMDPVQPEPLNGLSSLKPEKDEMSNVIPGAEPPYHEPEPEMPKLASSLMEDFMTFLDLKEMGLLDFCLGKRR